MALSLTHYFGSWGESSPEPQTQKSLTGYRNGTTSPPKPAKLSLQEQNDLVAEIHETFYTEVDRLLADAKVQNSLETTKQAVIDKYERLKKLGFANTKEGIEANAEIQRLEKLIAENNYKNKLAAAIKYFSQKYPLYKFITEDSVKSICKKYNLVYGDVTRYTGTVPDENLQRMEDFKIADEDRCYAIFQLKSHFNKYGRYEKWEPTDYINQTGYNIERERFMNPLNLGDEGYADRYRMIAQTQQNMRVDMLPLEIAAPIKDFNTAGMQVEDSQLVEMREIPDPVVLQPIYFDGMKHYLIVTAWGIEASDPLVINPIEN